MRFATRKRAELWCVIGLGLLLVSLFVSTVARGNECYERKCERGEPKWQRDMGCVCLEVPK